MKKKLKDMALKEIRSTLGKEDLNESYVVETKVFELQTEMLSEKTKKADLETLEHATEVLNVISARLDTAERLGIDNFHSSFRSLKIDEVYTMNDSFLTAYYLDNISDLNSKISMDTLTYMRLARDFGTFELWQKDFIACALSSRNGYAMTVFSGFLQRYINVVVDLNDIHVPMNAYPVIVLKMSESCYFRDYLNDKKSYIFAMMKELNWNIIEKRVQKAEKIGKVLLSSGG